MLAGLQKVISSYGWEDELRWATTVVKPVTAWPYVLPVTAGGLESLYARAYKEKPFA